MACARDEANFGAQGGITGLKSLSGAKINNFLELTYRGTDSYALDVNNFGGSSFAPADKVVSSNPAYSRFLHPSQGEFFLFRDNNGFGQRVFTTVGLDNSSGLCFFAVGRPSDGLPTMDSDEHFLLTDGAGRVGGRIVRLFGYNGKMLVAAAKREATIEFRLAGRDDPFGDFTIQPAADITVVTATLRYDSGGSFGFLNLSGTNGYTGSLVGIFTTPQGDAKGGGGAGAVFTFELRNAQGDVLFGAIASEANRI